MVKWKWAYPVIQESCTANSMPVPASESSGAAFRMSRDVHERIFMK